MNNNDVDSSANSMSNPSNDKTSTSQASTSIAIGEETLPNQSTTNKAKSTISPKPSTLTQRLSPKHARMFKLLSEVLQERRPGTTTTQSRDCELLKLTKQTSPCAVHGSTNDKKAASTRSSSNQMLERPVTVSHEQIKAFLLRHPGSCESTNVCCLCLENMDDKKKCCQMLCRCNPSRWYHSECITKQLAHSYQNDVESLTRCGFCRESVWGKHYSKSLNDIEGLLRLQYATNKQYDGRKITDTQNARWAYELSLDLVGSIIQCGGGADSNPILGTALNLLASSMCELDKQIENHDSTKRRAGILCSFATLQLGCLPSLQSMYIMIEMVGISTTAKEKEEWCNKAVECVQKYKRDIPLSLQNSVSIKFTLLQINLHRPQQTLEELLVRVQNWNLGVDVLSASQCYFVCSILAGNGGLRELGRYYEQGMKLDPKLFKNITPQRLVQIDVDLEWFTAQVLEASRQRTDKELIDNLGEWWPWDAKILGEDVLGKLCGAYDREQRRCDVVSSAEVETTVWKNHEKMKEALLLIEVKED